MVQNSAARLRRGTSQIGVMHNVHVLMQTATVRMIPRVTTHNVMVCVTTTLHMAVLSMSLCESSDMVRMWWYQL